MFWGVASAPPASDAIDALLDHPDVTVEQLLDEPDVLDHAKAGHPRLIAFWAQPRVAARLLEHVLGRAALPVPPEPSPAWHENVFYRYPYLATEILTADIPALSAALLTHAATTLAPFFATGLPFHPVHVAPPLPHHSHPLFAHQVHPPVRHGTHPPLFPLPKQSAAHPPQPQLQPQLQLQPALGPGWNILLSYWARIISHLLETQRAATTAFLQAQPYLVERLAANAESPAVMDLINRIIEIDADVAADEPGGAMVQWFSEHRLVPTLLALLSSVHSRTVHNNVASLLRSIIERSGPGASAMPHESLSAGSDDGTQPALSSQSNILVRDLASPEAAEMLVLIMLDELSDDEANPPVTEQPRAPEEEQVELPLCPMDMPSSEDQLSDYFTFSSISAPPPPPNESPYYCGNRLRGSIGLCSSTTDVEGSGPPPCAPRVLKTPETVSSALVTAVDIAIELIRKNNSDYFEQNLFQYLRQTIMHHQQILAKRRSAQHTESLSSSAFGPHDLRPASAASSADSDDLSAEEVAEVDEAVRLACDKMAIVHLGPLLRACSRRLSDLQKIVLCVDGEAGAERPLLDHAGDDAVPAAPPHPGARQTLRLTVGAIEPLGADRQRICELYAELLHCSNMALLNRAGGTGPEYDDATGTLLGGLNGFQALTNALNLLHCEPEPDEEEAEEDNATPDEACEPLRRSTELMSPSPNARATSLSTDGPSSPHAWEESTVGTTVPPNETDESKPASYEDIAWDHRLALAARLKRLTVPIPENLSDGDLLKERFLSLDVPSTLLDFFFLYPWNNLLHNVVYDIVQQCFTARLAVASTPPEIASYAPVEQAKNRSLPPEGLKPGLLPGLDDAQDSSAKRHSLPPGQYARALALDLLGRADLCGLIVRGSAANEVSESGPRRIRLGFMGHLNLIAGEAGKVLEKYPLTLAVPLREQWGIGRSGAWDELVQDVRRAEDAGAFALGGQRPVEADFSESNSEYDDYAPSQVIGTFDDYDDGEDGAAWAASVRQAHDGWHAGPDRTRHIVGDGALSDPLAAPDWDAEFQAQTREQDERNAARGYDLASASDDEAESSEESLSSSSASSGSGSGPDSDDANEDDEYDPFVDLLDPRSRAGVLSAFHPRHTSPASPDSPDLPDGAVTETRSGASPILIPRPRHDTHRRHLSATASSSSSSLELVAEPHSPFGPGVDPESTVDDYGVLVRTFDMGLEHTRVHVPLDDVALALSEAQHMALS